MYAKYVLLQAEFDDKGNFGINEIKFLKGYSYPLLLLWHTFAAPDTCSDPDLGTAPNNTLLNKEPVLNSKYVHDCGSGRVFTDSKKQSKENVCDFQNNADSQPTWKYSTSNTLPACIRKQDHTNQQILL